MSKPVILLDAGQLVGLSGAADGDVLTWNGTTQSWQSSPGGGVGTVTSVALDTAATGLTVSGGTSQTITGSGTFTLGGTLGAGYGGTGLGAPAVGDAGKVLTATASGGYELATNGAGTVTSVTAGAGLSGGTITTSGTISMPNVGTSGVYGTASSVPVITTDAQGRVSSVTPTAIAIAQSAVTDLVSDLAAKVSTSTQVIAGTGLSGGGALSGNVTLSLPSVGTQGTYGSASSVAVVTTDQQGRVSNAVTTAIGITQSQVADLVTDLGLKADKSVTATAGTGLTGGGTLGANFSFALDTVGTAASNQGSASKTVTISTDAYGRVTALTEQSISGLSASVISSGQLALAQGGTGIDASSVTGGQLLVGGSGVLALQNVSGDASLASTGALTVTGLQTNPVSSTVLGLPDAGKALVWSGTAWEAAEIQQGGGGGGLTLYMNYAASSPYVLDTVFDEHAAWDTGAVTVANDANGTELARFYTPTSFVVEVIPAGIWDINLYAQASGAINDTAVRAKVGVWNGSTLTILGTSDYAYITDPTVLTQYKASVYVPTTDLTTGDRIVVVLEGRRFAATTQTVTSYFGTGAISHVHSTLNAPGGTGLLKVVDGYLQSPASLLVDADVSATAAIAVSKLAAGTDTYVLTTVAGVPTWSTPPATGVTSLQGTADQVLVNATSGTPQTGALTLTLPQSIGTGSSPSFTGLTVSGLTNGIVKSSSGVLSGGNSVSLTSEVSGTLGIGNGGTGLTASGASGNLLVSDGSAWASVPMSGDATIASTGVLTLKNTGTAGTYGSASAVPVFVTDAQGRVTSVTNTNINFAGNAVTSITGTANQVTATGTVGSVTLSLPSTVQTSTFSATTQVTTNKIVSYYGGGLTLQPASGTTFTLGVGYIATAPAYDLRVIAGASSVADTTGGTLSLEGGGGASGNANGGDAKIDGGASWGTGIVGRVYVGTSANTSAVYIGSTNVKTTLQGPLTGTDNTIYLCPAESSSSVGIEAVWEPGYTGAGRNLVLRGGTASATNTNGGNLELTGGAKNGTGTAGRIYIGTSANTSVIWIGTTGVSTLFFGPLVTKDSTTSAAGFRLPPGTAPTSPTNGDLWTTTSGLFAQINGATQQYAPLASPTFTGTVTLPLSTAGYVKTTSGGVISSSASVPTSDLSGTLPVANGGTNNGSLSVDQGTVYYGDGSKLVGLAPGTSGHFLKTNGVGANPEWAAAGGGSAPYDVLGRFAGNPATNAVLYSSPVPRSVTVSTTTGNHYFYASALPSSGQSVITVYKTLASNGTKSALFTATWTAGQAAASNGLYQAVISSVSNNTLVAGDVLSVEMGTTNTSFVNPQFAVSATA